MLTQRVVWTALPNGLTDDRRRLRVSLLISPRLVDTDNAEPVLSGFSDWLDWPSIVRSARFEVMLNNVAVPAALVSAPNTPTWQRIFPPETPLTSRSFEDRRGTKVLAYPVAAVERDLAGLYGQLAVEATDELPLLDDLRQRFAPIGRGLRALTEEGLLAELRDSDGHPPTNDIVRRLGYANLYHTSLSASQPFELDHDEPGDPREHVEWTSPQLVPLPPATAFNRRLDFHARVSALAQYPALMRLTGLVVDLEIERDAVPDGNDTLAALVGWSTNAGGVVTEADILPETAVLLVDERFEARSRTPGSPPVVDGHLVLADNGFDVVQLDVNGSALKMWQFAIGMFQAPPGRRAPEEHDQAIVADPVEDPPDRTGAPALRSGGLTLARRDRAGELKERFASSGEMEDAVAAGKPPQLFLEDLVRGFHPEVFDDTSGEWHSLVRRDTHVTFLADLDELDVEDNEGMIRLAASAAADGSNPDIVKLYEGLFTWSGWSLAAPPVGRSVGRKDEVKDAAGAAPDGLPVEVEHRVRKRSLPSLRYGRRYRARVRVADLAGNALPFDPGRPSPPRADTEEVDYLRYEPVEAPTFALVGPVSAAEHPSYGEDLATAAIRSLNNTPADNTVATTATVRRHVVPPLGAQQIAERHGLLDLDGRVDPTTYGLLVSRDAALAEVPHPITEKSYPTAPPGSVVPFLPDPIARIAAVRIAGRTASSTEVVRVPWYAGTSTWPDARLVPVEAYEPTDPADVARYDAAAGVLRIPLAKADHVRVRFSHEIDDDALQILGMWRWALAHLQGGVAAEGALLERVREGRHWMFTPWRDLELVHAVQRPLVVPAFEQLAISRTLGSTVAELRFVTPVDSRSTVKLEVFGRWLDPVDDLTEPGPRAGIGGGARAAELPLRRLEAPGVDPPGRRQWLRRPVTHDFGDTRYRRVGYRMTGTTRFTKFLPPPLQEPGHVDDLTVTSGETIGWVPNSAPPPAPDVVYVVPTFGWNRLFGDGSARSRRTGGGLRVYLRRPWLVSGFMEMLGVVLPPAGGDVPASSARFVTQWGSDPTMTKAGIPTPSPPPSSFGLAVTSGPIEQSRLDPLIPDREGDLPPGPFRTTNLTLAGAPASTTVDVVPHLVRWDADRQLWYSDIVIRPDAEYMPFIRLALARYQPISSDGAHLSPIARTEVIQLLPDRLLTMTRTGDRAYRVAVYGVGPDHGENLVELDAERLDPGGGDLSWEALDGVGVRDVPPAPTRPRPREADVRLVTDLLEANRVSELLERPDLIELLRPPLLRDVEITLPRGPSEGERFRLVVTEFEQRDADAHHLDPEPPAGHDPRRRPIYVETIDLD